MSLKQRIIDYGLYSYDPAEFMPVRYEGKLQNKGAFMAYKLKQLASIK